MAAQLATTWIAARIAAKITLEIAAEPDNGPADWAVRKESRLFCSRDYLREGVDLMSEENVLNEKEKLGFLTTFGRKLNGTRLRSHFKFVAATRSRGEGETIYVNRCFFCAD